MMSDNRSILLGDYNKCAHGLLLPLFPHYESHWSNSFRALFYFGTLLYFLIGIAIVADVFMGSIEKITSKTKKIYLLSTGEECESGKFVEVRIWNDTVANLTLMALGASAPEILLSCIQVIGNNFEAGDLGPGTIVGSAAFNLLVVTGVCIIAIPKNETRRIRLIQVFFVTSAFSLFAYIWLLLIVDYCSPGQIDSWEAVLTLSFFPLMVLMAWCVDRGCKCGQPDQPLTAESILAKQQLFYKDGELNKQGLVKLYKDLKKFQDISDSEAAVLAVTKAVDSQPHSRLFYRIGACRGLAGNKNIHPVLSDKLQEIYNRIRASSNDNGKSTPEDSEERPEQAMVEFRSALVSVPENVGAFQVSIIRHGRMDNAFRVQVESFDGTAKRGSAYIPVNKHFAFRPNCQEREVTVKIVDNNQWQPDREFFLRLSFIDASQERTDIALGILSTVEIIIVNDDDPGHFSFRKRCLLVKESCKFASVEVERRHGAVGEVSVQWRTHEGSARSPKDFRGGEGTLIFRHGETSRYIDIPIVDNFDPEKEACFEVEIFNAEGGACIGCISRVDVMITNDDDDFHKVLQRMFVSATTDLKAMEIYHETYAAQLKAALMVNGGDVKGATATDYFMHMLTFVWKAMFALIPPTGYLGGWLCFFSSLIVIGLLTAIIGDLASLFGCMVGLKDSVTAITFVAVGTSLPTLFGSKVAAVVEKYADNGIGNLTGSNSVNVFLGLGLPWAIAAIFHESNGSVFKVASGTWRYNIVIYIIVASTAIVFILVRRYSANFGKAELGGPSKWSSGIFMFVLWLAYVILTSLQAYGIIQDNLKY